MTFLDRSGFLVRKAAASGPQPAPELRHFQPARSAGCPLLPQRDAPALPRRIGLRKHVADRVAAPAPCRLARIAPDSPPTKGNCPSWFFGRPGLRFRACDRHCILPYHEEPSCFGGIDRRGTRRLVSSSANRPESMRNERNPAYYYRPNTRRTWTADSMTPIKDECSLQALLCSAKESGLQK